VILNLVKLDHEHSWSNKRIASLYGIKGNLNDTITNATKINFVTWQKKSCEHVQSNTETKKKRVIARALWLKKQPMIAYLERKSTGHILGPRAIKKGKNWWVGLKKESKEQSMQARYLVRWQKFWTCNHKEQFFLTSTLVGP
jgi:hypothetical protein